MTVVDTAKNNSTKLNNRLGVYVAQARTESGILHADELMPLRISTFVAAAFVKFTRYVENAFGVQEMDSLRVDAWNYGYSYVVQPVILNMKGNSRNGTASNGAPTEAHQISLRLDIHSAESGERLNSPILHVTGTFDRPGIQCPCDLLVEPLEELAWSLYS